MSAMKKPILLVSVLLTAIASLLLLGLRPQIGPAEDYANYCAGCHGENLRSFIERDWVHGNSWGDVYRAIKSGYPDEGMPAFDTTFSEREISSLTDYILKETESITLESFKKPAGIGGIISGAEFDFRLDTIVGGEGLDIPWGLGFLPDGDLLITERSGDFYRYDDQNGLQGISGVPEVRASGQGGLLDVVVHPDFEENHYIYVSFSKPDGLNGTTAVMRGRLEGTQLMDTAIIFKAEPSVITRHHFGSRLVFDRDGYLYVTVGDRGRRDEHPQFLTNHCGKVHRIHDDGSIPADNPFVDTQGAVGSIWSYGHRNPQGLALHPITGEIWENEHGPRGGDEINHIQKGNNYGWPEITYGINYTGTVITTETHMEGMEQPVTYWVPSIAACGMAIVGEGVYPGWEGDIFSGSLRFGYLHRTIMEGNEVQGEEKLLKGLGRLREVEVGPDGYLYVTKEDPGYVLRLVPLL